MICTLSLLGLVVSTVATPFQARAVEQLNREAFEEAQQRDDTATRASSSIEIKTSEGQCLFVDELSGDFRANLNPIQVGPCDGSTGQLWDIITAGKHNDQPGTILVVNTLTQACMNFDDRRATGNTVIMFSCGGRADGGGAVTNSQLFAIGDKLEPKNAAGTCFTVSGGKLDQAACNGDASQMFNFGGAGGDVVTSVTEIIPPQTSIKASTNAESTTSSIIEIPASSFVDTLSSTDCTSTTMLTVTRAPAATLAIATTAPVEANPTTPVPVSRAGGILQPSSAAEAQQRDDTATRAFSSVSIKDSAGQCLFIDPTAGDFRQNLIPVQVRGCTGSAGEKFDLITSGKHNDQPGTTLVVSALTQGCLNFDSRRAAGDRVILFSCGGRADGEGQVTNGQLFGFDGGDLVLEPKSDKGICLIANRGKLDASGCSGGAAQVFSIDSVH